MLSMNQPVTFQIKPRSAAGLTAEGQETLCSPDYTETFRGGLVSLSKRLYFITVSHV